MSYLSDKLKYALGGEMLDLEASDDYGKWSPSLFKSIVLLDKSLIITPHFGKSKSSFIDKEVAKADDFSEMFNCLSLKAFNGLEEIFVSKSFGGVDLLSGVVESYSGKRLHRVGTVNNSDGFVEQGPEATTTIVDLGNDGWQSFVRLSPNTYKADKAGGALENALTGVSPGPAAPAKSEKQMQIETYFRATVRGAVDSILEEYARIFESGYEVLKPYGILSQDDIGQGVALRLSGSDLKVQPYDKTIQTTFKVLNEKLNLVICPQRKIEEIANVIVTGYPTKALQDAGGPKLSGNLYFPKKMLEFAYGRKRGSDGEGADSNFPPHSKSASWKSYSEQEVRKTLESVITHVAYKAIENAGLLETYFDDEAGDIVVESLNKLKNALCTCVMISKYDSLRGMPSQLKIRVLDPYGRLANAGNLATESVLKAIQTDGGRNSNSFEPRKEGFLAEFHHEVNHQLANAEPLFAFKALEALQAKGEVPSFQNLILGIASDDTILKSGSGGKVDFSLNLAHAIIAGSRAGKGVMTQNFLAAGLQSKKPLFYLDNKPDIASLLLKMNPAAFAVNGRDYTHSPDDGTDYFGTFLNRDDWVTPGHLPPYVSENLGTSYDDLGAITYTRALLLVMGIIAARVRCPSKIEQLGGKDGILLVVDELTNASSQLNSILDTYRVKDYANTQYAAQSKQFELDMETYLEDLANYESTRSGARPTKPTPVASERPSKWMYWFTYLYKNLEDSLSALHQLSNAGLKNTEAKVSDIFVLSQTPFNPIQSSVDVALLVPSRNTKANGRAVRADNKDLLPSLALLGGVDAFLGYNKDINMLNQHTVGSHSHDKLDANARNFAYVANFMGTNRDSARNGNESFARTATYFKPFLIFADGSEDSYFVKNAMSYAEKSGINPADIVALNEDPSQSGKLNPAVGFESYIEMMGLSKEDQAASLGEASEIAQFVVSSMGYPGSWRDFLTDLRPEWLFSVNDVVKAVMTGGIDPVEKRLEEFYTVYPEAFMSSTASTQDVIDFDELNGEGEEDEEGWEFGDQPEGVLPGSLPGESVQGFEGDDEVVDLFGPTPTADALPLSTPEEIPPLPLTLPTESPVPPVFNGGPGENMNTLGEREDFEMGEPTPLTVDGQYENTYPGMGELVSILTRDVVEKHGGPGQITSLRVLSGGLIVNRQLHRVTLPSAYEATMPPLVLQEFKSGNVARYFDWSCLNKLPALSSLNFDSVDFVYSHVSTQMGWGSRVSVDLFYQQLRSLNRLLLGADLFTRSNYRSRIADDTTFYQPRRMERAANVADRTLFNLTRGSWNFTRETFSRTDISGFSRFAGVTFGLVGSATAGTAAVGVRAGRGFASLLKEGLNSLKNSYDESKRF